MCPYENAEQCFIFLLFLFLYFVKVERVSFLESVCTVVFCANKWYQSTRFVAQSKISLCENVGRE